MSRLFDAAAFAGQVRAAAGGRPLRAVAAEADVSAATLVRVLGAYPNTSHETVLRLQRWLEATTATPSSQP